MTTDAKSTQIFCFDRQRIEASYLSKNASFLDEDIRNKISDFFRKVDAESKVEIREIIFDGFEVADSLQSALDATYQEWRGTEEYKSLNFLSQQIKGSSKLTYANFLIELSRLLIQEEKFQNAQKRLFEGVNLLCEVFEECEDIIDRSGLENIKSIAQEIYINLGYFDKIFLESFDVLYEEKSTHKHVRRLAEWVLLQISKLEMVLRDEEDDHPWLQDKVVKYYEQEWTPQDFDDAIQLLDSWDEGDPEEQSATFEVLTRIDEGRDRKLFKDAYTHS